MEELWSLALDFGEQLRGVEDGTEIQIRVTDETGVPRNMTASAPGQGPDSAAAVFAETARRYCEFVEAAARIEERARLQRARLELSDLVHAACQLPSGDADGPDVDHEVSTPTDWPGFGDLDVYHEVLDPYVDEPPGCGSLSDDLLDIYRDLKRGLVAYDAGQVGAAVWEWRFHFDHHWGDHAVDALRALQRACNRWEG